MARMEQTINNLVEMFMEYASDDGVLSKDEFMKLMETEIEDPEMKEKLNEAAINKILKKKDRKHDGQLHFGEFVMCVSFMIKRHYNKKGGKGQEDEDETPEAT
ncbi:protein S100-A9-like [Sebastes umbrosus]|uniref:protein S100-A9-like n=1 Tax=Sebastes umbrosus TaxID=72105 RepID=UPI00189CA656|nr:protein S100-A9-like [Sebastes umbrosus]XP_037641130.1 protein S100-A9-like [Sebastes umbrosus]